MGVLDDVKKRLRPGSGATGPISVTEGAEHDKKDRRAARPEGMSAPGFNDRPFSNDGQSWPVALASGFDADRGAISDPDSEEERVADDGSLLRPFARHDPDDEEVLSKLFRLDL